MAICSVCYDHLFDQSCAASGMENKPRVALQVERIGRFWGEINAKVLRMNCLNCEQELAGKYCSHCGQRSSTKRITLQSIFENLLVGFSNIDKGFLYNIRELSLRPGKAISAYLAGKRVKYFHPVQYAILLVSILTFLDVQYGVNSDLDIDKPILNQKNYDFGFQYGLFLKKHIKFMWLLLIIFFSIPGKWFFSKLNIAEHLTIQSFIIGHAAFITICFFPLVSSTFVFNPVMYLSLCLLTFFTYREQQATWTTLIFSLLIIFIGLILFVAIPATIVGLVGII